MYRKAVQFYYDDLYERSQVVFKLETLVNIVMIIGPIFPFLPQARLILRNNTLGNFSIITSFLLINSNFLRILFWYLKEFKVSMVHLCILVKVWRKIF